MKTKKQRIVTILLSAIVIVGMAFLLNFLIGSSKAEVLKAESPNELVETNPAVSEPELESQKVQFNNKTAEYDGLTMEVLSMSSSGNDAIVEVLWELKDSRDWKINNAALEIDSQAYSYAGFDMQNPTLEDDCSSEFLQETPYRVDRLIFANVPGDFLNRSIQLRILGLTAFPSESEYCKVLNIEHIQKMMQEDFPGLELECFQEDGLQGYGIKESSPYAKDEKALALLSDHAVKALFGNMAGIWKFDLTAD